VLLEEAAVEAKHAPDGDPALPQMKPMPGSIDSQTIAVKGVRTQTTATAGDEAT